MRQRFRTHGQTVGRVRTKAYRSWITAKRRCSNPNANAYHRYGGRGIAVCERWQKFENFLADMGERPEGTTLDRWPNRDGNYEPGNCRWATPNEQAQNREPNIRVAGAGSLAEYARQRGVNYAALWDRIQRGQTAEAAANAMLARM